MAEYQHDIRLVETIEPRPITSRQRTGRVFFIDTFEKYYDVVTEKWKLARGTVALDTDYPKAGMVCMKLSASQDDYTTVYLFLGAFPKSRFGLELDIQSGAGATNIAQILFKMDYWDGTTHYVASLKWLGEANKKWQYLNSSNAMTDVTDGAQDLYFESTHQPFYHNLKLLVDYVKYEYIKILSGKQEFDLSGLDVYSVDSGNAPKIEVHISISALNGTQVLRVDNVILTDQEP